jgi:glycosyltransferase involved in cell wall biosynthesis
MSNHLFAVIPAFNESSSIVEIVGKTKKHVERVIVIDDGSTDDTQHKALQAGATLIRLSQRQGYSAAVIKGLSFAIKEGGTNVVTIDADGAHLPEEIPDLVGVHSRESASLTIGNRFAEESRSQIPTTKRWSNYFASKLVGNVMDILMDDVSCGFRVLDLKLILELFKESTPKGYGLPYSMISVARRRGLKICGTPVNIRYRVDQVLCTPRGEFLDFIDALRSHLTICPDIEKDLNRLARDVNDLKPIVIRISGVILFLNPLETENGYSFELQSSKFEPGNLAPYFDFDRISEGNCNGTTIIQNRLLDCYETRPLLV